MGQACCKHGREPRTTTIINNRWRIVKQIGKGGFGSVYTVEDLKRKGALRALKTETIRATNPTGRLPQEAVVMNSMQQTGRARHICQLLDKGRVEQRGKKPLQFIVMTLLGPSLTDMQQRCRQQRMHATTVALLGLQCVEAIQDMHDTGFIHRDIKPQNFTLGLYPMYHNVYLIDFGMCRKYLDSDGHLLPVRKSSIRFRGTYRYCASDSHKGIEYSRHHDLWCLFNSLIELRNGELPWQRLEGNIEATFEMKNKIIPTQWLQSLEPQYLDLYEWLTTLHYDIKPDYKRLSDFFIDILKKDNMDANAPFEWEPKGRNSSYFRKANLDQVFGVPAPEKQIDKQSTLTKSSSSRTPEDIDKGLGAPIKQEL